MYRQEIDTWDYPWTASVWFHGGLTVTPNVNLVSNIGFGPDATHTTVNSEMSCRQTGRIGKLMPPNVFIHSTDADGYVFNNYFGGKWMVFPHKYLVVLKRFLKFFFSK
jgi:hypothetical protein